MEIKEGSIIMPLPTEALLSLKEERWRLKLPPDYRSFIMDYNGGIPKEGVFTCEGKEYHISRFLCVLESVSDHPSGWQDISVVESQIGEYLTGNEDLIGVELLPIAKLSGGDYVCLDYRNDKTEPAVCVWSHGESGEYNPVTYQTAGSFTELASKLR